MARFLLNRTMFFVLVTAFLSMLWSPTHIHLAEHHDHSGSHHQHAIEAHAHQSITENDKSVNSTQHADDASVKIVKLDIECRTQNSHKLDKHLIVLNLVQLQQNFISQISRFESLELNNSKQRYIDYSTIYGRAPPKNS